MSNLTKLGEAIDVMADAMMGVDIGNTFAGMTCSEVESIAAVFKLADRLDAAGHVLMMHGEGDDDLDDRHRDVFVALRKPDAGFSHSEADEPFRLAMAHVRELV